MLWLFSGVSFWCLSLGMDELDKLREEVASLRDEMAFFRGRVAAIEEKKEALAIHVRTDREMHRWRLLFNCYSIVLYGVMSLHY